MVSSTSTTSRPATLGEVAAAIGARLDGDPNVPVAGLATLKSAGPDEVSFLANRRYRPQLAATRAAAVVLSPQDAGSCPVASLVVERPQAAFATLAWQFAPQEPVRGGVHDSAVVDASASVAADAWIGPHAVVEPEAQVGRGVFVGPGCVVGRRAVLGEGTRLVANVTVCRDARLGRRVIVHPGAVLGADGFGLVFEEGRWHKIPQLGSIRIGDDVEIGSNTTVDRGALDDTVLEDGVKLDNLIQVGHNCFVGAHTVMAGCVGVAGSARIGRNCMIGGGAGIGGHLEIPDNVQVTGMSMVPNSIPEAGVYSSGLPVEPNRVWNKISARVRQLDELARRIVALEKKISKDDDKRHG